jgi:hypothetical protein
MERTNQRVAVGRRGDLPQRRDSRDVAPHPLAASPSALARESAGQTDARLGHKDLSRRIINVDSTRKGRTE